MAENLTPLMFSVSIEQLDKKLKDWTEKIAHFANNGGKGYKLKIDFGEAEDVIKTLKNLKIGDNSEILRLQRELDNVKKKLKELNSGVDMKTTTENITKPLRHGADESKKVADEIEKSKKRVVDAYTDIMKSVNALQMDRAHARGLGIDVSGSSQLVQDIKAFAAELSRLSSKTKFLGDSEAVNGIMSQYRNYLDVIRMLRNELRNLSNEHEKNSRQAMSQKLVDSKSVNEAIYQISQLEKRLSALRALQSKAKAADILTPGLDSLIRDMERYMRKFQQIYQNGGRLNDGTTTAQMVKSEGEYRALTARITENTRETRINMVARQTAIATVNLLATEEQRLAQAITQGTMAMHGQSQVMRDLKSLATQYVSVWGAKNILDNIIQTGGLLEQQRLSIGAILGDMSQANALFGQIKSLALRSPFGVVQLDTMSKQLTAYDFDYNEIYDWVRRIGDISAATGTEASRLALALGHVKSEGALSGYTLRQFAMGNVPLLATLAKQLGKTTAEIRKMTKEKAISYDDVVIALKSMTEGNGLFANAQETMSQALNAKFKNLRDAFDLMWGDIAESGVGDALKSLATSLTDLTKHWKPLVADLAAGAAVFGTLKAATMFWNTSLGQTTASTMKQALTLKQQEAAQLRVAQTYRTLTTVEKIKIGTANTLNAYDLKLLLNTKKLTGEELLRSVAMGKVNKQMAISAVQTSKLDAATKQLVVSQIQSLNGLRRGAIMWATFTNGIRTAALAVGSFLKQMAPMAALMLVTDAWMSKKASEDAVKDRLDSMREKATEGYKNLLEIQKQYPVGGGKGMDKTMLSQSIDEMVAKLKDYSLTANDAFNNAFKIDKEGKAVHSLSEQYDILAQALADTTEAYKKYHEMIPLISHALESSTPDKNFMERIGDSLYGWMLGDNAKATVMGGLKESLENYTKQVKEAVVAENIFLRNKMEVATTLQSLGYENVLEMENDQLLHLINTMKNEAPDTFRKFYQLLNDDGKNALNGMTMAWRDMNEAYGLANLRMRKAGQDLYESMKAAWGGDVQKWPTNWREIVMIAMNQATGDVKEFADLSEDYQNMVRNSFLKPFKITVDTDEAHERVNNLLVDLQNLIGRDWTINIGIKGEDSFADVDAAQKAYKDAQEKIKQAEERLKKLGNPKVNDPNLSEYQRQTIEDYNYQIARRNRARSVIESYGGTPEEPKAKKTGGTTTTHKEDALAKLWQNRVEILKKYRSEMEKYEKVMSRGQAMAKLKTNGNFAPMFNEGWFSNPNDFTGSIDEAIKKLGTGNDRRKALVARWGAEKEDFLGDRFRRDIELTVDELGRLMSVMAENYETYKKWLNLTGDDSFAARIAGVAQNSSLSGWLTKKMSEELIRVGDTRSASEIFNLTESEVKKLGKDSAIYKIWDSWQNNRLKVEKESLAAYEKAIKSAMTYADRVAQINGELERQNKLIQENKSLSESEKNRAISINNANAQMKVMQMSNDFSRFFNGFFSESRKQIQKMADTIKNNYNTALRAGAITAKEYADKISEINKRMRELEKSQSKTRAYLQGGLNGLFENMQNRGKDMQERGAQMYQDAERVLDTSSDQQQIAQAFKDSDAGKSMMQIGEGMEQMGGEMMQTVAIIDMIVHGINDLVQGLKGTFDEIREMYDALGHDTNTDGWEDWNTFWSSFSDASNSATKGWDSLKNGNVGGVIEGVVGSFTGWITGFAKGHDKKRQNHIEALQRNVDALEANTEVIKSLRGRTLGYDTGALRRYFASLYKGGDAASNAMRQFYTTGSGASGYAQELAALEAERQAYVNMYNEEDDKKDSSDEALLAFKKKIAELDEQIHYFSEDLAKELWDIDIKGWADQLSDGLSTAFENGESAAKAYKDTVTHILQQVMNKMMRMAILEHMFANLEEKLFGSVEKGTKGVFNAKDPKSSMAAVTSTITNFFGKGGEGEQTITAALEFMNAFERGLNNAGLSVMNDSANTLSSSVQGTSEETSDLLAGYVNAARQDLSIMRILQESQYKEFVSVYWHDYVATVTGMSSHIAGIHDNTQALVRMIERGDGALFEAIKSMSDHINNAVNGIEQVAVK